MKTLQQRFYHQMVLVAGVLQGDTLAPYIFIIVLDYTMRQEIGNEGL